MKHTIGMKILTYDVGDEQITVESPSLDEVVSAIKAMDGTSRSQLGVFVDDDTYLQVSGGDAVFVCSVRCEDKLNVLYDPNRSDEQLRSNVAGPWDDYPENQCFPIEVVLGVTLYFVNHLALTPDYDWLKY